MNDDRRLLVGLVAVLGLLTAVTLWNVLGTVFFALTVVYVVEPVYDRLVGRGIPPWWAGALSTALVFVGGAMLVVPFALVLYRRRADVQLFLEGVPDTLSLGAGDLAYTLEVAGVVDAVGAWLGSAAVRLATASTILGVKATVFGVAVFGLLLRKRRLAAAVRAAVPDAHHAVYDALATRTRDTLLAIYVLQAATAAATFVVAVAVFALFGYRAPVLLALFAGVLQFLPVVGPSVLVAALVVFEFAAGRTPRAFTVGLVAWVLVAWLPDVAIRPRLAARTAHLPGSLYFVGFTGGLLTVGAVGIIAGPLLVALLLEAFTQLAATHDPVEHPIVEGPFD